jgi:hypothetical protein
MAHNHELAKRCDVTLWTLDMTELVEMGEHEINGDPPAVRRPAVVRSSPASGVS